ncbi:MAG: type VII secretion protein EccB [Gordonia sp. (in: high G+C Gram-positive bacteria)]|uniref:type VII secretion protein EccB n=1 Tax=Gordonia sp. (in: high G+C Gram-positive bacteria) TaxID=84139 RepID=UPI0039E6CB80
MSRQFTTRAQVSGYRFGVARAEHALVRRDARMLDDPLRAHWRALFAGLVIAILIVAGAGLYGLIRPKPAVGDARLVADRSGALFVLVDDVMHPVSDLASARLILGEPVEVKTVSTEALAAFPRGPSLGIPGAPASLPVPGERAASSWTVCDDPAAGTAVLAEPPTVRPAPVEAAALVRAGDDDWLVYQRRRDGSPEPVRARVDLGDAAVRRVFGLDDAVPRPVSEALLNTFPPLDDLAVPDIDGRGGSGPGPLAGVSVGTVVRSVGVDGGASYAMVLADGIQPVGEGTAELLRAADPAAPARVPEVTPADLASVPVRRTLPVTGFPERPVTLIGERAVLCGRWSQASGERARRSLLATGHLPLPAGARVVTLTAADGDGPGLDGVYLTPGTAAYVALSGAGSDGRGARYLVTDAGVAYPVPDGPTAAILGLGETPAPAPAEVIGLLPPGPALTRESALTARDVPR